MLTARLFRVSLAQVRLVPGGLRAEFRGTVKSFKKLVVIYLSGPAGNFLLAALFFGSRGIGRHLFEANLAIGLFNLIPVHPLDGGQILLIVLYKRIGSSHALKLMKKLSLILKTTFCLFGFFQLMVYKNPSLLIAALVLPGRKLLVERISMIRLENLFSRRQRILKRKVYPVRHVVALEDCNLGEVLQKLDYDRFHIIYILNSAMEITGQVTEQQILKALETHGSMETIRDVLS